MSIKVKWHNFWEKRLKNISNDVIKIKIKLIKKYRNKDQILSYIIILAKFFDYFLTFLMLFQKHIPVDRLVIL